MLKSWQSLLRCELVTCVCFVRAYTCVCVCVCVCVCTRACLPSTCSHLSVKHADSHPLRTRSHRHRVIKHLSPCNLNCGKPCTQSCACMEQQTFRPRLSLAPDPAGTLRKVSCRRLCFQMMFGGIGSAERRVASSSYQTLSQFFPQHCSLHPWSPKLVCPDRKFCLA